MIVDNKIIDRLAASLRIFGMLVVGAVLIAGMNSAISGSHSANRDCHAAKRPDAPAASPQT